MNTHFYRKPLGALVYFLTASLLLVTTACAATGKKTEKPAPPRGNDCVFFRTLYDWQGLDQNNLVIWAPGRRDAYHVYLSVPLVDMSFAVQLAFIDKDGDGQLCGFSRDEIAVTNSSFPQRSMISSMQHLDVEGIARLEEQFKTSLSRNTKKKKPREPDAAAAQ